LWQASQKKRPKIEPFNRRPKLRFGRQSVAAHGRILRQVSISGDHLLWPSAFAPFAWPHGAWPRSWPCLLFAKLRHPTTFHTHLRLEREHRGLRRGRGSLCRFHGRVIRSSESAHAWHCPALQVLNRSTSRRPVLRPRSVNLDLECARPSAPWIALMEICLRKRGFNFGVGCGNFMFSHVASPKAVPVPRNALQLLTVCDAHRTCFRWPVSRSPSCSPVRRCRRGEDLQSPLPQRRNRACVEARVHRVGYEPDAFEPDRAISFHINPS